MQLQGSYTLSKTTDLGQAGSRVNRDGDFAFPEPGNFQRYEGPADWDARHRVSATGYYVFPDPPGPEILQRILGGWQLTGVMILQSGIPWQPVNRNSFNPIRDENGNVIGLNPGSGDYNADGYNYDYPNAPAVDLQQSFSTHDYMRGIATAADFPAPEPGTPGNMERHILRGPGLINVDTGMIKNNRITERVNLQLRFEFFNVLNRVNLRNPVDNLGDTRFGRSVSTFNPRIIQLGARLVF
jgi:hypothetical protein